MAHDALICPQCGNLRSVCSDPNVEWHPHANVCYAAAAADWGRRRLRKKHENYEKEQGAEGLHPLDGLRVFAAQLPPEDDEFA